MLPDAFHQMSRSLFPITEDNAAGIKLVPVASYLCQYVLPRVLTRTYASGITLTPAVIKLLLPHTSSDDYFDVSS